MAGCPARKSRSTCSWPILRCRSSITSFVANAVRLQLHALAYNLAISCRGWRRSRRPHRAAEIGWISVAHGCSRRGKVAPKAAVDRIGKTLRFETRRYAVG
jgi:hypothetical protein